MSGSKKAARLLAGIVAVLAVALSALPAHAADLSRFRAGNIIADEVFFDSDTMTLTQIDVFLRRKGEKCQPGYVCLADYRQNTPDRPVDDFCSGYAGRNSESAAAIIAKVAQSCGINPQVLIVMLQKEQGLVTHRYPSAGRYDAAMGQGCPDDAGCDPAYRGFFYQVYYAARQFQRYVQLPYFSWYDPGRTWNIQYHERLSCGTAPVYVENVATSVLYYYTPYQPNAAALAAGYGDGDSCSSTGNRNFFSLFWDWFGNPQGLPVTGFVDVGGNPSEDNFSEFAVEIGWMSESGISTGYGVGGGKFEYRPFGTVTRDAMAAFLYRAAGSPAFTAPVVSPFVDVTPSSPFYKEITWLAASKVSTGWDVGGGVKEFRPFANITRDAMAAFLYRFAGSPVFAAPSRSAFVDVATKQSFYKEIAWLAGTGVSGGWAVSGGKEFRPYNPITRDAMAAFLYRYSHRD